MAEQKVIVRPFSGRVSMHLGITRAEVMGLLDQATEDMARRASGDGFSLAWTTLDLRTETDEYEDMTMSSSYSIITPLVSINLEAEGFKVEDGDA